MVMGKAPKTRNTGLDLGIELRVSEQGLCRPPLFWIPPILDSG